MTGDKKVEKQVPTGQDSATVPVNRESRRYSRRGSSSRSSKKIFRLRILVAVLSVVLVVAILGWIVASMKLAGIREQFSQYQLNSRQEISNKENRQAEIDLLNKEKELLLKGVIPGLRSLEFDSTINVDDEYFRNIGFTLTGTSYTKNYEYRIVLHNDSLNVVKPEVTVFLFDDRGIQVGVTVLSKINATSKVEFNNLQPNETRSYTGRIELNIPSEPKYFLVSLN